MNAQYYIDKIKCAKFGDQASVLNLLELFNPILRKYAYKLSYDDAYADLRYGFLALIRAFPTENYFENDGAVVSYIQTSLTRAYIRINKRKSLDRVVVFFNELSPEQSQLIEDMAGAYDDYSGIFIGTLRKLLTVTEFNVIYRYYVFGFSIAEIAAQNKIARQTVNETKIRAVKKLRNSFDELG